MDYYSCQFEELQKEIRRRGYTPFGTNDQLSEGLRKDDDARGTEATTVRTDHIGQSVTPEFDRSRTAEFGNSVPTGLLANEKIVYWTMNTFFPAIQLFFESGLSCTIEGARLPDATVGLDPRLRFRLTDCTHEEDGRIIRTTVPEKFARAGTGLVIWEASIAQRTSIAVKPGELGDKAHSSPNHPLATIVQETHTVVGLRLEGMKTMAYIWAKAERPSGSEGRTWGDVRVAGLREDVPVPLLSYPEHSIKPGRQATVVTKESMISGNAMKHNTEDL